MLGNHFWAVSARHAIKNLIFVKLYLNTWLPLSLKLTFSSQNCYQKFSPGTTCLGPCPSGKEGEKVTCPKGKSTCPRRPDGGFFEPCLESDFRFNFNLKLNNVTETTSFYTWQLEVAVTTYIKILWTRIPNKVMWSNLVMQNIVNWYGLRLSIVCLVY